MYKNFSYSIGLPPIEGSSINSKACPYKENSNLLYSCGTNDSTGFTGNKVNEYDSMAAGSYKFNDEIKLATNVGLKNSEGNKCIKLWN